MLLLHKYMFISDLPVVGIGTEKSEYDLTSLHTIIKTLQQNLQDTKSELLLLKRREQESKSEMDQILRITAEEITRHIEAALPKGVRGQRMEADKVEAEYKTLAEETYANIKLDFAIFSIILSSCTTLRSISVFSTNNFTNKTSSFDVR